MSLKTLKNNIFYYLVIALTIISTININCASEVNDQQLAKELIGQNVDLSLAHGWADNKSTIFTTIYDQSGAYRGYRTTQIFKDGVSEDIEKDYKQDGAKVCSIFEIDTKDVDYEQDNYKAIDFVCMQEVGNQKSTTINGDKLTINKGYGQVDGYLVGVRVYNKTFSDVKGAEVVDNTLFIISDDGGSAILKDNQETTTTKKPKLDKQQLVVLVGGSAGILLLIVLIILLFKLFKRKRNNKQTNTLVVDPNSIKEQATVNQQNETAPTITSQVEEVQKQELVQQYPPKSQFVETNGIQVMDDGEQGEFAN